MSARRLATYCLALVGVFAGNARAQSPGAELVVYLRVNTPQPAEPMRQMKATLESIMGRAGYDLTWRSKHQQTETTFLAVVDFSGVCAPGPAANLAENTSLASTSITDGRVLPFSSIDCTALTRALGPVTEDVYGRAMARVLAHELYHVLTQTTDHSRTGIAKTCFTTGDLLSSRLDFENNILAQLRRLHRAPAQVVDADDDATGRQPF